MRKILYIKLKNSSFIRIDEDILKKHFEVKSFLMDTSSGLKFLWSLVKMKVFLLKNLWTADAVFIRFADYYAFVIALFTILFRKKLIIVVGGYDAVHIPEYQYGVYHSKLRAFCVRFAYRHADLILPNNPTLIENTNTYSNDYPRKEGVKYFVPETKAKIQVVYNGFKPDFWHTRTVERKENSVLTVAFIDDYKTFILKGLDSFIELAFSMPETHFTIVGISHQFIEIFKIKIPNNLKILERTTQEELANLYYAHKVFCLLSLTEGMPNVLCEAMLCGCIPVGSNVNAIPEIIGETGFVVMERKIEQMKNELEKALKAENNLSEQAKKRIIDNYSIERREKELVGVISSIK